MVTAANTGGVLVAIQKPLVEDSWGSWQAITNSPATRLGPTIQVDDGAENYDVIFALQ